MKDRLKKLRKALGLRQRQLAETLGVATAAVGGWETGREIPKTRVYQICKEFRVRREWLESGKGEMFEPEPEPVDARGVQREFVLKCFKALPEDAQDLMLDALRDYVKGRGKGEPRRLGAINIRENRGNVTQNNH